MNQKFIVIIQARMGSSRFPGKTLFPFLGRPSLGHLLDSVRTIFANQNIIIATSESSENSPILEFCISEEIDYYIGDEKNVASRFIELLRKSSPHYFIRLNADSPLLDMSFVPQMIKMILDDLSDICSTTGNQKFPSGMNIEILKTDTFIKSYQNFTNDQHYEHVTKYFYEKSQDFKIKFFPFPYPEYQNLKFSFDTKEDCIRLENFFSKLNKPQYKYTLYEKCRLMETVYNEK